MIRLNRDFLLRTHCYCVQAERSLHRAVQADWSEVRRYYADKREAIQELVHTLNDRLPPAMRGTPKPSREECHARFIHLADLYMVFVAQWTNRWRTSWRFAPKHVQFLVCTLQTLLELLEDFVRPAKEVLTSLRVDFCVCEGIIERRCFGLPELKRALRIEHFDRTPWFPHFQLSDIVPEPDRAVSVR